MPGFIDLRPGLRVNVMPEHGALSISYESEIRQVAEDVLRIDRPRRDDQVMEAQPGDELTLLVQLHGRMYTFVTRVREVMDIPIEVMVLDRPTEVRQGERRQFYRLLTNITPERAVHTNAEGEELQQLRVRILDLSGGGVQLRVEQWVPVGAHIDLTFALEGDPVKVNVDVLALTVQQAEARRSFYRVNGIFVDVDRAIQEQIIRYIFSQQRLIRQRWTA